ncbi:MAG: HK97 family phage prohead protease [Rubrivivax sp.]|nr:HK97 family phage prohead protease [Rubrivivax sp.]MDH5339056.1 HK97 family phage prohead protease [Rubrivivax sp.]
MHNFLNFNFEVKALNAREFEGYGSVFGNEDLGGDIVLPGAFAKTIAAHKANGTMPLMFWMHQQDQVPGVWTDMREDGKGLYTRGEAVDTQLGRDVRTLLQKKAVRGLSMGYVATDVDWKDGRRLLKQVDLFEVSIVSMAMNPLAQVEAVKARLSAIGEYVPTEREMESHFRKMGCSRVVARSLIARLSGGDSGASGMPAPQWDAGEVAEDGEAEALARSMSRLLDVVGAQALARS